MANAVRTIARPMVPAAGAEVGGLVLADFLTVEVVSAAGTPTSVVLAEADHAGLLAEFAAGTATTILEAAIEADFGGVMVDNSSPTQQSWKDIYVPPEASE